MKVQATRQGFYDQVLREPGEVFDLIDNPDGTMPLRMIRTPVLDKDGKPTEDFTETVYLDRDGNPMHADFAPSEEELRGRGAFRGDIFTPGWMVEVPEEVQVGLYDPEVKFGANGREEARPLQRYIRPSDQPVNAPRATPMRGNKNDRVRRASP